VAALTIPARKGTPARSGTRRAILRVTEQILARHGEAGLSIREVCARTGVTAPTVYHHFGDKDGLVAEVVDACFAEFDRALAAGPVPLDPVTALGWSFDRYVAYGAAHPAHYRLLFQRKPSRPIPSAMASYARLERMVRAVEEAGRLRVPVDEAAPAFWAAVHGVTSLVIAGFLAKHAPGVAHVRDAMLRELTTPGGTALSSRRGGSRS